MKSIRIKILLPVIIMLTFFIIFMGGKIVQTKDNLNQIKVINEKYYATLSNSKDLKLVVIQVQQFLTDISATRAGEHGRGFSVVAMEVRKLSEESAVATEGIAQILQNIDRCAKESIIGINHANIIAEEQKTAVDSTSDIFKDMTGEIEK